MNKDQVKEILKLPNASMDGTIQNTLMRGDIEELDTFESCQVIIQGLLQDKQNLQKENQQLSDILRNRGLYTSEVLFGNLQAG